MGGPPHGVLSRVRAEHSGAGRVLNRGRVGNRLRFTVQDEIMKILALSVAIWAMAAAAGCHAASNGDVTKMANTSTPYAQARQVCWQFAVGAPNPHSTTAAVDEIYADCLRARGWADGMAASATH